MQLCIPPGDSVGRELVLCGALESDDGLGVAVGHAVGVVASVVLVAVRLAALAGSLVGSAVSALQGDTVITKCVMDLVRRLLTYPLLCPIFVAVSCDHHCIAVSVSLFGATAMTRFRFQFHIVRIFQVRGA